MYIYDTVHTNDIVMVVYVIIYSSDNSMFGFSKYTWYENTFYNLSD